MIRETLVIAVSLLVLGSGAAAQTNGAAAVEVGPKVRLKMAGAAEAWREGTVAALSDDSLWLARADGAEPLVVPLGSIQRLQVSRGQRSNFGPGVAIGFLGGALVGAAIGLGEGDDPPEAWIAFSAEEKGAAYALVLGGLGGLVGGVIGATTQTEKWAEVTPAHFRLSAGADGRLTLAASYRF